LIINSGRINKIQKSVIFLTANVSIIAGIEESSWSEYFSMNMSSWLPLYSPEAAQTGNTKYNALIFLYTNLNFFTFNCLA
jgi:hypothetical protein